MIKFVNAKINIGLQIVRKRPDGYHDLQTVFYPIGLYAGTPENPTSFCDILEISSSKENKAEFIFTGRKIECEPEKNLVCKAARLFSEETGIDIRTVRIALDKHIPDGAGIGGGSADASITLKALAEYFEENEGMEGMTDERLMKLALRLGADCPFFIINSPAYAEGVGERLERIDLNLKGYWLLLIKPDVYVSTKDAFAGVKPMSAKVDLRRAVRLPVAEWKGIIENDFETSIFPRFPLIGEIKGALYKHGAEYASMSGSGSSVYGIFRSMEDALKCRNEMERYSTIEGSYLLKM